MQNNPLYRDAVKNMRDDLTREHVEKVMNDSLAGAGPWKNAPPPKSYPTAYGKKVVNDARLQEQVNETIDIAKARQFIRQGNPVAASLILDKYGLNDNRSTPYDYSKARERQQKVELISEVERGLRSRLGNSVGSDEIANYLNGADVFELSRLVQNMSNVPKALELFKRHGGERGFFYSPEWKMLKKIHDEKYRMGEVTTVPAGLPDLERIPASETKTIGDAWGDIDLPGDWAGIVHGFAPREDSIEPGRRRGESSRSPTPAIPARAAVPTATRAAVPSRAPIVDEDLFDLWR
jgi:hypothetical protein